MKKNKVWLIISILLVFIVLGLGLYVGLFQQTAFFDDFITEDDFSIPSLALTSASFFKNTDICAFTIKCPSSPDFQLPDQAPTSTQACQTGYVNKVICDDGFWNTNFFTQNVGDCGGTQILDIINNKLTMTSSWAAQGGYPSSVKYLKDMKNRDIKTKLTYDVPINTKFPITGVAQLKFNDKIAFTETVSSANKEYLIEAILDIENENLYHVFINGEKYGEVEITEPEMYVSYTIASVSGGSCPSAYPITTLKVSYLRSRPYQSCDVDNDEVVIRDVFNAGSTFAIQDLTYKPMKFCVLGYPAIKRSFTDKGIKADIMGQLTKKLTTGQSITVGDGEIIEFYYIADYKEGMGLKCSLDEAYDTTLKKCVKIITEQEDIIKFINNKEFIVVGKNQVFFENNVKIADKQLTSSQPSYSCQNVDDKVTAPDPDKNCWSTTINYNGKDYPFIYGDDLDLNDYFKLKWLPQADFDDGIIKEGWVNNFVLSIKNDDVLQTEIIQEDLKSYWAIFGVDKKFCFKVKSNVGKFTNSGVQIKQTKELLKQENTYQQELSFDSILSEVCIGVDTKEYGAQQYEVNPFYKIGEEIIFDNEKITRNFEIVDEIPVDVQIIETEKIVEKPIETIVTVEKIVEKVVEIESPMDLFKRLLIAIPILLLIIGVIVYLIRSKR